MANKSNGNEYYFYFLHASGSISLNCNRHNNFNISTIQQQYYPIASKAYYECG